MSEIDDIDDTGESGEAGETAPAPADDTLAAAGAVVPCLSCGNPMTGVFCAWCGQKNDDLRRSIFLLGRNFLEDTFSFDSRMWRTLGLMALAPGAVPKDYTHGKRSQFTPPVRLFLVISFLFFLVIALTDTLFLGLDIEFREAKPTTVAIEEAPPAEVVTGAGENCSFQGHLRFFVKESDLTTDKEKLEACFSDIGDKAKQQIEEGAEEDESTEENVEAASQAVERAFSGVNWAVANPRAFNNSFNSWLPRVLFLMTPVLALLLAFSIRGKDALIFDHLVMSLYTHAASFAIIGASLIIAQFGAPLMGVAAFIVVALYYIIALKRAYSRGWVKTLWAAFLSGVLYLLILILIMLAIVSSIIWQAPG